MVEESTLNLLYQCHWEVAQFLQLDSLIYSLRVYISHFDPNIVRKLIQLISTYVDDGIVSKVPSKHNQDFSGQDWVARWLAFIEKTLFAHAPFPNWSRPFHITELFAIYWISSFLQISAVMTLWWFFRPLLKKKRLNDRIQNKFL